MLSGFAAAQILSCLANIAPVVNATPATPVSDGFAKMLVEYEGHVLASTPVDEVQAHRTAEDVFGPVGEVTGDDVTVTLPAYVLVPPHTPHMWSSHLLVFSPLGARTCAA